MKIQTSVLLLLFSLAAIAAVQYSSAAQWERTALAWRAVAESFCNATVIWEDTYGFELERRNCDFSAPEGQSEE